jgi:hypothetical protein
MTTQKSVSMHSIPHHLVIPGLLDNQPEHTGQTITTNCPLLTRLLSRANRHNAPTGYAQTLFKLFGLATTPDQDLPTAALSYHATAAGQANPLPDRIILHADPIHLKPDQDRLLAFDFYHQPLTQSEARQYAKSFNKHFAEIGIQLIIAEANIWYLSVQQPPEIRTQPLTEVLGRNIDSFLPTGPDATIWRTYFNEIQMLWHQIAPNIARETTGQFTVSGIWPSGAGQLPRQIPQRFSQVTGDSLLLKGLAQHTFAADIEAQATLHVEQALERAAQDANQTAWDSALQKLEHQLEAFMQHELYLYPCAGHVWCWQPKMRYRWWRRTQTIANASKKTSDIPGE